MTKERCSKVMTIMVTGGAGFIGSNFICYMMKKYPEYRIVCVDKLTYAGNLTALSEVMENPRFRFVKTDICDRSGMERLFSQERPDIVVNFAAESHVDRSIEDSGVFIETNVLGTGVLMDVCKAYGVGRFHQISTDEVYGSVPIEGEALTENAALRPGNPYAASKAAADLLVMSYYRTHGLPVSISRCSNNYGAHQFPEKLIPLVITRAMRDELLPVYGDGSHIRDWIYVTDHCAALDLILHRGKIGEIYHISANQPMHNLDVVKCILRELGKGDELIEFVQDRKGHDTCYAISAAKIQAELGWKPEMSFEEGLRKTVGWYLGGI